MTIKSICYVSRQIFRSACHTWCNILQSQGQFNCTPIDNSPVPRCTFWLAERHNCTDIWNRWVANTVKLCALHRHQLRKSLVGRCQFESQPVFWALNRHQIRDISRINLCCTIGHCTFWKEFKMSLVFFCLGGCILKLWVD